jgi:S1-C subfamily serine protease
VSDPNEPSTSDTRWVGTARYGGASPGAHPGQYAGYGRQYAYPGRYGADEYGGWQPTGSWQPAGAWDQPTGSWQHPAGSWPPVPPPRRRHPMLALLVTVIVVVFAMAVGGVFVRTVWPTLTGQNGGTAAGPGAGGGNGTGNGNRDGGFGGFGGAPGSGAQPNPGGDPTAIASAVAPTIVDVNTTLGLQGAQAAGTGIVLTSTGEVLTNNHVIAGATSVSVTDVGNGQTYQASVLGYDRSEDIAVIQLKGASGLRTASIGDSSKVNVGDGVVALGNAGGVGGAPSVVTGSVTATNQAITASDENGANAEQLTGLIQVAANIQPGDSGGPLVDNGGHVIGMDTAASGGFRFQASGGEGFAIPINQAVSVAKEIKAGHASSTIHIGTTAFLGVDVAGSGNGNRFGGGATSGAQIAQVVNGSPAEQAGLTRGDVITSVDGKTVDQPSTLTQLLDGHHPGDQVKVGYVDTAGQSQTATVRLATGPAG